MELRELQFFVVSVDAGSLSQAAQILYTTQPHVSKTIKKLERTLGYQLLERSKKGVELTKEGEKVYDQARKMLSSMEEIQRIQMETQESTIRIASMPSSLLSEEFATFLAEHPKLHAVCYEETLEKIIHHICHRQVEVGFVFISKMQRQAFERMIQKRKMTFTPLKEKDMALYVGPNHPYYEKEYVTKEELRNLRYVQHEEDQISLLHTSGHLQEDLIDSRDFQQIVTVNSSSLMQELLKKDGSCQSQLQSAEGKRKGQPDPYDPDPKKPYKSLLRISASGRLRIACSHGGVFEAGRRKTEIIDKKTRKTLSFLYKVIIENLS